MWLKSIVYGTGKLLLAISLVALLFICLVFGVALFDAAKVRLDMP